MHEIEVLHVPGCTGGIAALTIALRIAAVRQDVVVRDVLIGEDADAARRHFRGSPTVLVDGRDVETESQTPIGTMG